MPCICDIKDNMNPNVPLYGSTYRAVTSSTKNIFLGNYKGNDLYVNDTNLFFYSRDSYLFYAAICNRNIYYCKDTKTYRIPHSYITNTTINSISYCANILLEAVFRSLENNFDLKLISQYRFF